MAFYIPRTFTDLQQLVQEQAEESLTLEFKRALPPPGQNDEVAADIAAMANTEGGVIAYGVGERAGHANSLHAFSLDRVAERLTQIAQSLDGPVTLLEVLRIEENAGEGYVVVVIPKSERSPHFRAGRAMGRTPRGNMELTRRHVGELFARSRGFAEEFGLIVGRPGRLKVSPKKELRPGTTGSQDAYIRFENDGDSDIEQANWRWVEANAPPVLQNPFPLAVFQSTHSSDVRVSGSGLPPGTYRIETTWRDRSGQVQVSVWPVSWL